MMNKKLQNIFALFAAFFSLVKSLNPDKVFAQNEGLGCGGGLGPFAEFFCDLMSSGVDKTTIPSKVGNKLNETISTVIGFLTTLAAIWFIIRFILAAFAWISAGGDKGKLEEVRNKMLNSVLGLLIVVVAWLLIALLGAVMGIDILNPGKIIQDIGL